jgi:CheY-like chemotaxis protein
MGGEIHVTSERHEGSVFTVELPADVPLERPDPAPVPGDAAQPAAPAEPSAGTRTVLVIDDDPAVRDLMMRFLGRMDYRCLVAASGTEGLELARKMRPDIITLDVVMPGMDGWDVLSQLKADPDVSQIPVIMMTVVDHEAMGLARGASNYLVKPIDRDRLATTLAKYRDPSDKPELELVPA